MEEIKKLIKQRKDGLGVGRTGPPFAIPIWRVVIVTDIVSVDAIEHESRQRREDSWGIANRKETLISAGSQEEHRI